VIRKIIVIAAGILVGTVTSQAPEFMQQYTQRLGGWLDHYNQAISELVERAENLGQTRDQYIAALIANSEAEAQQEGEHWAQQVRYQETLADGYQAITGAPPWTRPFLIFENARQQPALAEATWAVYKPAVPATVEGAAYAGIGFLAGALLVGFVAMPFRRQRRAAQET
jgi:hypothetical protein